MADDYLTLADLATINDKNLADIDVSDLLDQAPLLAALAADVASNGTSHKYTKETGAPVVGFRSPNTGRDQDSSVDTLVTVTLKILDATSTIDKAIADAYHRGADALVARELRRHLKAAFFKAEEQIINGTDSDSDGFDGLIDASTLDGLADEMVIDAGGSTANSSVFMIRTNDDGSACMVVSGEGGRIDVSETIVQLIEDGSGQKFPAYVTPACGWLGLQVGGARSVGRLANLDAGSNTLTDDLLADLYGTFPAGLEPNLCVMHRRSRTQLQKSRTATSPTGANVPIPTHFEDCQIITTDAVSTSETTVA